MKLDISYRAMLHILHFYAVEWVAGDEVIVKNVNANIPVSLSWTRLVHCYRKMYIMRVHKITEKGVQNQ